MTEQELKKLVIEWDSYPNEDGVSTSYYGALLERLEWFGEEHWSEYQPASNPKHSPRYIERLANWIGNLQNEEDQKVLLEYALQISYFSHSDFVAFYQTAFSGPITQWVIEKANVKLDSGNFDLHLQNQLQKTWYCPVTDSMDINEFYHVNHITGIRHRPAFSTLAMLDPLKARTKGKPSIVAANLINFMKNPAPRYKVPSLERLILLEDFVGSGTQSFAALKWALDTVPCPILYVPLIICPLGIKKLRKLVRNNSNRFEIRPVLQLSPNDILGPRRPQGGGWKKAEEIERIANESHKIVNFSDGPFGFNKTGCSVVNFTNTPNNSLSLIHDQRSLKNWSPLFPRSERV